jgi:nucleoside-diphosphate-sugar epimerase
VSGVVGRAIATELGDEYVVGLTHRDQDVIGVDETVHGDLSEPRLGLHDGAWRELADRVDVIVHSAALTAWGQPRQRYDAVNVGGTQRVAELAQAAGAPLHMISSCFVHAVERRCPGVHANNVVVPYIWSKWLAERIVAASVPSSIYRLTNVIGDSRSGASGGPQIVQQISDWICRGKAPYLPGHPGNRVDVVPLDVTAQAVARAVRGEELGRLLWLTYGKEAMTLDEAQRILIDHARDAGRTVAAVPVVDPDRPLPVPLNQVPATSRQFLQVLIDVSEVTRACGGVLPSSLSYLREGLGVADVRDTDVFKLSLKYWAAQPSAAAT